MRYDVTRGNGARTKRPPAAGGRPREEAAREQSAPAAKPRESGRGASLPPGLGAAGRGPDYNSRGAARRADGASPQGREGRCRGGVAGVGRYPLAPSRARRRGSFGGPFPCRPAGRLGAPRGARPHSRRSPPSRKTGPGPPPPRDLLAGAYSRLGARRWVRALRAGGRLPRAAGGCGAPAYVLPVPLAVSKLGSGSPRRGGVGSGGARGSGAPVRAGRKAPFCCRINKGVGESWVGKSLKDVLLYWMI